MHIRPAAVGAVVLGVAFSLFPQLSWSKSHQSNGPEGVSNFGQVSNQLYRGGQPSAAGFAALQKMGITTVVNFRDERDEIAAEKREVEGLGMKFVSIPWSGSDNPSDKQVVQFLDLMHDNPQAKVFVHCKRGADRTGTMVAAYRIAIERKDVSSAIDEMHDYHYAHFMLPQLQRYVVSMPKLLQANTLYASYAPAPASPAVSPLATIAASAAATIAPPAVAAAH
jgi:tyrosine-protein phosphatase SIW14